MILCGFGSVMWGEWDIWEWFFDKTVANDH